MEYTLLWAPATAAAAPEAVLEELGVRYELRRSDGGKVPVLAIHSSGEELTETAAIVMYLAERHPSPPLSPRGDGPARQRYLQWMLYATNTIQPLYYLFHYPQRFVMGDASRADLMWTTRDNLCAAWKPIDAWLAQNRFMTGENFSACDLFVHMLSTWQEPVPDLYERFSSVARHAAEVSCRPSVRRVLANNGKAHLIGRRAEAPQ